MEAGNSIHSGQCSVLTQPEDQVGGNNQLQLSMWITKWDCSILSKAFAANLLQSPVTMAIVESLKKLFFTGKWNVQQQNYDQIMVLTDLIEAYWDNRSIRNIPVLINNQNVDPLAAVPNQLAKARAEVHKEVLEALLLSGASYYRIWPQEWADKWLCKRNKQQLKRSGGMFEPHEQVSMEGATAVWQTL